MTSFFLDSGYIIALEVANDQYHESATVHWQKLVASHPKTVTTSSIVNEVVAFFNSKGFHSKAVEIGHNLIDSQSINLVHVNKPLFYKAWEYFKIHQDKTYSLTDCISFVLMKQLKISKVLTFDQHFVQAGFTKLP